MQIVLPDLSGRDSLAWQQHLEKVAGQPYLRPFQNDIIEFVNAVALRLLRHNESRNYPDVLALGYWLRKKRIHDLKVQYETKREQAVWGPRGLVLHFAPANVDTIFMYSWFISLLLGNSNVIRVSQQRGEQANFLIDQVNEVLGKEEFKAIRARNLVLSYGHEEEITGQLSGVCQMRVIWGGDETIRRIRRIPLPPQAMEITFADRFSLALLNADKVQASREEELQNIAVAFYNDAFWFDQNACSSPRAIIWVGKRETVALAEQRFWQAVCQQIYEKKYTLPISHAMNRLVTAYDYAIAGCRIQANLSIPTLVQADQLTIAMRKEHCGGGLFIELERETLDEVADILNHKDQTLTVYGFLPETLYEHSQQWLAKGLSRIVPMGKALEFNVVWDGYDLLRMFTKELFIEL